MQRKGKEFTYVANDVFANVIKAFLKSDKFKRLRPNTQRTYRIVLRSAEHPDGLGGISIEQIRPALVQAFLDAFADVPAMQQKAQTALKSLNRWALVRDLLPRNIMLGTEAPGSKGGHEPWTDEQVAYGEANAAPHLARAITLGANTGQRGSDLIRMRRSHIEVVEGHPGINVVQQKTGLPLWVPFTQHLIAAMESWDKRLPDFLLLKPDGQPFANRGQLADAWSTERRRHQPLHGLRLHGLRATAVVRLRRAGVSLPLICDMIGMSEDMVRRYCRLSDKRKNALAAVEALEVKKPAEIVKLPTKR